MYKANSDSFKQKEESLRNEIDHEQKILTNLVDQSKIF